MAIFVLTNAQVLINSVDLSDHTSKVTCKDDRAEVDVTVMGSAYVQVTKGLGTAEITIVMFQDFASSKVHQTLQPLIGSSSSIPVEIRPVNAARSATNPAFYMANALMFNYDGLDGKVGDAAAITVTFKNAPGGAGMTYPTS